MIDDMRSIYVPEKGFDYFRLRSDFSCYLSLIPNVEAHGDTHSDFYWTERIYKRKFPFMHWQIMIEFRRHNGKLEVRFQPSLIGLVILTPLPQPMPKWLYRLVKDIMVFLDDYMEAAKSEKEPLQAVLLNIYEKRNKK